VDEARGRDCHRIDIYPMEDEAGSIFIRLHISTPEDTAGHWIDLLPTDALSIGHAIVQKSTAALDGMVERSRNGHMRAAFAGIDGARSTSHAPVRRSPGHAATPTLQSVQRVWDRLPGRLRHR
jgi:hypothetical protein